MPWGELLLNAFVQEIELSVLGTTFYMFQILQDSRISKSTVKRRFISATLSMNL